MRDPKPALIKSRSEYFTQNLAQDPKGSLSLDLVIDPLDTQDPLTHKASMSSCALSSHITNVGYLIYFIHHLAKLIETRDLDGEC